MARGNQKRFMTTTLYLYLDPVNAAYVRHQGAAKWGSFSNYINYLIASARKDRSATSRCQEYAKLAYAPVEVRPKAKPKAPIKHKKAKLKKALKKSKAGVRRKKPKLSLVKKAKKKVAVAPQAQAA